MHDGGKLSEENRTLRLSGANSATLYYTAATEYTPVAPLFNGADPVAITKKIIKKAVKKGYEQLKADHIADYRNLYDRVSLEMDGDKRLEQLPTDKRYEMLKTGMTDDAGLKVLLFNLGRYLLLSASRAETLPSGPAGCMGNG